ncbi:1,4-dihydroxy-6-naphthoate synthase [Longispora sp. K20-0274]|uniref:1,4-dihydroxy-6-naphthoate synthase n=1 Tax=Longispora sp. K20-0274 TaxID=3088255 RepID=UPI00399A30D5
MQGALVRVAYSPCPNDTFVFHALAHGLVPDAPALDVTFADVDVTNTSAATGEYDLVKVSYAALPWLLDTYELLPCGGALGRGCGPLVVTRPGVTPRTVAVPGDRTTAYLLFRLWAQAEYQITVVPFHEIMPGVAAGRWDAGLVIHEARFTYSEHGLVALADLGEWWEGETGLPIPLGAILAHRDRVDPARAAEWVRASVRHAWAYPAASQDYVMAHAQELSPDVAAQHIDLYVNEFTEDLGEEGYAAIETLLGRASAAGLIPAVSVR